MAKHKPPNVTIYKPPDSPFWWAQFYYKGKRARQPTPYKTKPEAERYARLMTEKLRQKYYGLEAPVAIAPITLRALADEYIEKGLAEGRVREVTRKSQSQRVNWFVSQLGEDRAAESISEDEVVGWIATSLRRPTIGRVGRLSVTTVHNYLVAAKACYRWGVRRNLIGSIPWQHVRIPKAATHRNIRIPDEDVQTILNGLNLSRSQHRSILLACFCGLRQTDHAALTWEDWDWKEGVLRWTTNKNGRPVTVVLPEAVRVALARHRGIGQMVPRPGRTDTWKRITSNLCGEEYSFKWFRHTFETGLAEAGVDFGIRQRLMGHSTGNTTLGYEHVSVAKLREAVSRLPWSGGGQAAAATV
jgi:integrase